MYRADILWGALLMRQAVDENKEQGCNLSLEWQDWNSGPKKKKDVSGQNMLEQLCIIDEGLLYRVNSDVIRHTVDIHTVNSNVIVSEPDHITVHSVYI